MGKTGNRELREALPETLVMKREETKAGSKTLVIYKKQNQSIQTFSTTKKWQNELDGAKRQDIE